jgi:hypothetical protein
MKRILSLLVLLVCLLAHGQESLNVISKSQKARHNVYVNYSPISFNRLTTPWNDEWKDDYNGDFVETFSIPMNGFGIGYDFGLPIMKNVPLYVTVGINFNYSLGTKKYWDGSSAYHNGTAQSEEEYTSLTKRDMKYGYISVPINLEYDIQLGDIAISPQIGIGTKINCFFRETYYVDMTDKTVEYGLKKTIYPENVAFNRYEDANRTVQFFGNVGLDISYKKWFVGCSYFCDFNHFQMEEMYVMESSPQTGLTETETTRIGDFHTLQIRVGYSF